MENTVNAYNAIDYDLLQVINIIRTDMLEAHMGSSVGEVRLSNMIYSYMAQNFNYTMQYTVDHILAYYQLEYPDIYAEVEEYLSALVNIGVNISNTIIDNSDGSDDTPEDQRLPFEHIDDILVENGTGNIRFTRIVVNNPRLLRDRYMTGSSPPSTSTSPTVSSFFENIKIILDKDELARHKTLKFKEVGDEERRTNDKCVICQFEFKGDDSLRKIDCDHLFHKDCIDTWLLEYNYKCPICRKECGKYTPKLT
jgi:hypothetical protein